VGSIEHTFVPERIAPGIDRLTLPMPSGPKHVHCYVVEGDDGPLLVDTGLGFGDPERWGSLGPLAGIVITHMHPDHVGGAVGAASATGAGVVQGELDAAQARQVWGSPDWPDRIAAWFLTHGVPRAVTNDLIEQGHAYAPFVRPAPDPELVREGDRVGGWDVLDVPGHADGHIALLRDGVLLSGDHLLARISPAVGLYPESRPDPLGDYLASLERTIALAPRLALPGHGDPVSDPVGRARELIAHHGRRLAATEAALSDAPRSAFEVSHELFGADLAPTQRRFAVAETLSHLERLVFEGRAARSGEDGNVSYTAAR
jgi:glyoxylase-like metal-dependent hydrolase (beta-lactamase superfamily II)